MVLGLPGLGDPGLGTPHTHGLGTPQSEDPRSGGLLVWGPPLGLTPSGDPGLGTTPSLSVQALCKPFASLLQALCKLCASLVQALCMPCASLWRPPLPVLELTAWQSPCLGKQHL